MTANAPGQVCLMQGNEAIVRGALEAGINFAASYPGSPSSQVLGMLGKVAKERNFYAECFSTIHLHDLSIAGSVRRRPNAINALCIVTDLK